MAKTIDQLQAEIEKKEARHTPGATRNSGSKTA